MINFNNLELELNNQYGDESINLSYAINNFILHLLSHDVDYGKIVYMVEDVFDIKLDDELKEILVEIEIER